MSASNPMHRSEPAPAGVITGVKMCSPTSCDRIDIHWDGPRNGNYLTAITADDAVTLVIKLEREVFRLAAKKGYTCPSLARLMEHRKSARLSG